MICPNCNQKNKTAVKNSRSKNSSSEVWRRRFCSNCKNTFTTTETPKLNETALVTNSEGKTSYFSLSILNASIYEAFGYNKKYGAEVSLWLSKNIESQLLIQEAIQNKELTTDFIKAVTFSVLENFDERASLQYRAQQNLNLN